VSALLARWVALLASLDRTGPEVTGLGSDLLRRWQEPQRHYHTLSHLGALLDLLPADPASLPLAVWFHDAIYDPRAADNEEASAALARESLPRLTLDAGLIAEVSRLVLLTKQHTTAADDTAGQLLLDADLSILGAPEPDYDAYADAIRREYTWVEESAYRAGRAAVLRKFLERAHLYQTDRFRRTHEAPARRNLQREIARLEGTTA
jgi:predicted metal-dependent HD superfamily phosphohydrolase